MRGESVRVGRPRARWYRPRARHRFGLVLLLGAFVLIGGAWWFSGDLHCPADPDESSYGEAEWSWFPVGTTCRWTEERNGFDRVEEPGWVPTIGVTGIAATGLALMLTARSRVDDP